MRTFCKTKNGVIEEVIRTTDSSIECPKGFKIAKEEIKQYTNGNLVWASEYNPELDKPTLDELKKAKHKEIASARYMASTAGMPYNGHIADTDNDARVAITAQAMACQLQNTKITWKMQDGYYMEFTPQEFIAFAGTVCGWIEELFAKEKQLQEKINEASSVEDLEKIKWEE